MELPGCRARFRTNQSLVISVAVSFTKEIVRDSFSKNVLTLMKKHTYWGAESLLLESRPPSAPACSSLLCYGVTVAAPGVLLGVLLGVPDQRKFPESSAHPELSINTLAALLISQDGVPEWNRSLC